MFPTIDLLKIVEANSSEMTEVVLKYEGTVDKYMGDAIMAFYGAPPDAQFHIPVYLEPDCGIPSTTR